MLIEHFSTLNGWSMKGSKAICGLLKKRKKSKNLKLFLIYVDSNRF
jgi:hypothetical protein